MYPLHMAPSQRTQVLLDPLVDEKVRRLASKHKRSMSAMCSELIEFALSQDKYNDKDHENFRAASVKALIEGADLSDERMQKLIKLLDMLD